MTFGDFYGIQPICDRLYADMNGGHNVHAYLFVGPKGTGKNSMAEICARALNCTGADKPCGVCHSCRRMIEGTHPDIIYISRGDKQNSISVDVVRGVISQVMTRPYEGGKHVVIFREADFMTPQAQNALLKTLEVPPESVVFFHIAESPQSMLQTIKSRCRIVRFYELPVETCAEALAAHGIAPERAHELAHAAHGSVGVALTLSQDQDYWQVQARVLGAVRSLKEPDGVSLATGILKDDKDNAQTVLSVLEQLALDLIGRDELGRDLGAENDIAVRGDVLLRAVMAARERAQSNVVWINLIEKLFFEMAG